MLDRATKKRLLVAQRNEITEHFIYKKLSEIVKDVNNKNVLKQISNDELKHYNFWKKYTKQDIEASRWQILKYVFIARAFGLTFGIKLMEKGEEQAQAAYDKISKVIPDATSILKDEAKHEKELINLIDEERLKYVGSMVLGLNDALVELTGALAGLTLALQNTKLIAMAGLITGIAASFSMAASEYLSTKSEESRKNPLKASVYTGIAYIFTVLFLIFPYLLFENYYFSLAFTLVNAIIVILIFTFYISVAKDFSFKKRFFEMALISLGIAALSFGIGFLVRIFLNINV